MTKNNKPRHANVTDDKNMQPLKIRNGFSRTRYRRYIKTTVSSEIITLGDVIPVTRSSGDLYIIYTEWLKRAYTVWRRRFLFKNVLSLALC